MNTYRVDRVNQPAVPCGMNSLLYIGDSSRSAHATFDEADIGLDAWNQPNPAYGVIFSVWNGSEFIIKRSKGL